MIRSCRDKRIEAISAGIAPKGFPADLVRITQRKLAALIVASELDDLRTPPGNRLEALKGARQGQYSIRVNDQWRLCFRWVNGAAEDVEFVDYH